MRFLRPRKERFLSGSLWEAAPSGNVTFLGFQPRRQESAGPAFECSVAEAETLTDSFPT